MSDYPIAEIRSRFTGLQRLVNGNQAIFFDGPGGSQSPESVGDAVKQYLLHQEGCHQQLEIYQAYLVVKVLEN